MRSLSTGSTPCPWMTRKPMSRQARPTWSATRALSAGAPPRKGAMSITGTSSSCIAGPRGSLRSGQRVTAVDQQRRAGGEGIGSKKEDGRGDVAGLGDASERQACVHGGELVGLAGAAEAIPERRLGRARRHGVDANRRRQFEGEPARQRFERGIDGALQ